MNLFRAARMMRAWVVIVSAVLGAVVGLAGYTAWLLDVQLFRWWPWVGAGGMFGLALGLVIAWRR